MEKRRIVLGTVLALAAGAAGLRALQPGAPPAQISTAGGLAAGSAAAFDPSPPPFYGEKPPGQGRRARHVAASAATPLVVYVAGEVRRPGVYRLPPEARVEAALQAAGGAAPSADLVAVNLAEPLRDGEEIAVPPKGSEVALPAARRRTALAGSGQKRRSRGSKRSRKAPPAAPLDVNAADATQLATIPGIGERLAERLVAFRAANGPFASAQDLLDVNGVSEHLLDEIEPYLTFGAP